MKRKYSAQFVSTYTKAKALSSRAFEKQYLRSIKDPSTLHFQLKIGAYPCFYYQDSCQNLLVNDLLAKNAELNSLLSSLTPLEFQWAQEDALVKEVRSSLSLDNIPCDFKSAFEAIHIFHGGLGEVGALSSNYLLIADGVTFPLKELEDVRRLYDFLMRISLNKVERPDTALFRNKPHVEDDIRLSFIAKGDEIKYALKEALSIFELPDLNIFVKLALFDFFFEYAHPFNAKNNRMLRFIDSYYIHKQISKYYCFFLSQCEEESISTLKKSFRLCVDPRNRSDLTTFCNAFLAVLSSEYDQRIYALRRQKQSVESLKKHYSGLIEEPLLSFLIDGTVFLPCGTSAYDLASLGEVSSRTILRALAEAKKKGFINENPLGKTIHYTLKVQ
jgi:Uncharacterized conserved protein